MQEIEDNFKSNGGKFEEFRIGDLFEEIKLKKLNPADSREFRVKEKDDLNVIPAVVAKVGNNGVMYYVKQGDYETTKNKLVVIGDGAVASGLVYYHKDTFTILHNAYAIQLKYPDFEKEKIYLYFQSVIQKSIFDYYGYEHKPTWSKVQENYIQLPTQNGEIAFDYMEAYIKELEADRVKELEADRVKNRSYLMATGLKDYTLTKSEQIALEVFENSIKINNLTQMGGEPYLPAVDFQTSKIGDLFEIATPKRKFDANKITFGGQYPYVARGDKNNGIRGLITEDTQYLNNGNTISFGQDTATMFYQSKPYFTGDKIKIFSFRQPEKFNKYIALSLIATMKLGFSHFAWGASFNVKKLQEVKIQLPTQNNAIDFEFMHTFIRAIEKIVIKEVVEWAGKKIQATKQVIQA